MEWLYGKAGIRFLRESVDVMIREFGKEAGAFPDEDDCIDGVNRAIAEGMTRPLLCLFDCVALCTGILQERKVGGITGSTWKDAIFMPRIQLSMD